MVKRTLFGEKIGENRKVRVIEGLEPEEFSIKIGESEFFIVEISKSCESESIFGLEEWLFWGRRKSFLKGNEQRGKNESSEIEKFFAGIGKKEVLP